MKLCDFDELTEAEEKLITHLRSSAAGGCVIGRQMPPENADPALHIRTSLIRALALQQIEDVPLPERGLNITGAYISGDGPEDGETRGLDLEGADLRRDLGLIRCRIPDRVLLRSAGLRNLYLSGSDLPQGLGADRLEAKGSVFLSNITAAGGIRLPGATLGGSLTCNNAKLTATGDALTADGLETKGGVFLRNIIAAGQIRLLGAKLAGSLACEGAKLVVKGEALHADRLETKGSIFLRNITTAGQIRLLGAKLGGSLSCEDAKLTVKGKALHADRLEAKGGIFLRNITAAGEIRLPGAKLGGDLTCNGTTLTATGKALNADGLEAKGGVFLSNITAAGEIRLLGAKLGGNLSCTGATLTATGKALNADGLEAKGSIVLRNITAAGEIRLTGAKLGGNLACDGATLTATEKALNAERARIDGTWFWRGGASSTGTLNFQAAEIGSICDDPACWPPELLLDRCRYGAFIGSVVSAEARIDWLSRVNMNKPGRTFWPHPYEECARALREAGHGAEARAVLIEKERLQRKARRTVLARELWGWRRKRDKASADSGFRPYTDRVIGAWLRLQIARVWDTVLGEVVAYGRRPGKATIWLAAFLLLGWFIFARAAGFAEIKPNQPRLLTAEIWTGCATAPVGQLACFRDKAPAYPEFAPLIYSADTLLPIVNLEMQSYWIPDDRKPIGAFARFYLWCHIFAGWALTLLAVAGFSGLIKTDNTK